MHTFSYVLSNISGKTILDYKASHTTIHMDNTKRVKTSSASVTSKELPSFGLDRSKYKNLGFDKFKDNPLMQTLLELKKNFPFKDHVNVNASDERNNCSKDDILHIDKTGLTYVNKIDLSQLSSQLQAPDEPKLYFDMSATKPDKIDMDKQVGNLMKKSVLPDDLEKLEKAPTLFVSKNSIKLQSERKKDETAGKGWYNLPKTELTDKIKNDLQLIKMRNVLDSKHHYKRNDSNKLPKYFQIGTVVEGAHEFYSARVPKHKRKRTMVDELLDDAEFRRKNKKKYIEIRKKQMSGGKGFYKKLKNKSKKAWERT